MAMKDIAVFGAGGFGLEVAMLIEQINAVSHQWNLIGFFDDGMTKGQIINDYSVHGGIDELNAWRQPLGIVFALGSPVTKMTLIQKLDNTHLSFPALIHPSVIMGNSKYVSIGEGSIICAGTIITTNITIGRHVVLNLACTVGHETSIGDYSAFMPTCNISGEVIIGECTYWGTGAIVINRCRVGDRATIGAGAVVVRDVPPGVTAVGVPAKIINKKEKT
jgi:sugar O-acyltransferase (sialic acid O-acetyltransferase NeuD family)